MVLKTKMGEKLHLPIRGNTFSRAIIVFLLCLMMLISTVNAGSVYLLKQESPPPEKSEPPPGENPVLNITYAENMTLDLFNFSFVEEGLVITFMNGSKDVDVVDIWIYVNLTGVLDVHLDVDNGALIDRVSIDLCDEKLGFLESYGSFEVGDSAGYVDIDEEDLIQRASNIGASCIRLAIAVSNWSANVEYRLTIKPEFPEGMPPGPPPPVGGEADVYVLYDARGGFLDLFNVSSTEEGMDILFSNASVASETIDIIIFAGIEAINYVSGFNASIDNGARLLKISIDLCDQDFNLTENYQTIDLDNGTDIHSIYFDSEDLIKRLQDSNASFVSFRITVSGWNSNILYTLHIRPFFKEILYYETEDTVYVDPSSLNLPQVLRFWWRHYNETQSMNWTYQDIGWEFGPNAHYEIYCYNSSSGFWYEVTPDTWIILGSDMKINVTIPKSLFEKGTELREFEIHWNMWAGNISAFLSIVYDRAAGEWRSHSRIENYSNPAGYTEPYMGETAEFFTLNRSETYLIEMSDSYNLKIMGRFNDLTPKGIYYVDINIIDNESNFIRGCSYFAEMSTGREIAIGGPWSEVATYYDKMMGGTYRAWVMNSEHEPVHSVGFNETFIIRVEVTGLLDKELANVSVVLPFPWSLRKYVNVTGWHEEYRVHHGGWIYNKTSESYVWDPNATIITREWVYGPYLQEVWEDWSRYERKVNVTRWEWNGTGYNAYTYTEHVMPRIMILYDNLEGNYGSYFIYEYWNDTLRKEGEFGQEFISSERHIEIEDAPPDIMFYQLLNVTKSVRENNITVEFVGKFVKRLSSDLWLDYHVFSVEREIWPNWQWMEENARFISIEKPIVTVRIYDEKSDDYSYGDYLTEPGEWFIVEAKSEGSSSLKTDVDGIRIRFEYNDCYWSENETIWSNLRIVTTVNLHDGTYTTVVYNETSKSVYEYGLVEIWNATTGRVEEVETWHWEYYTVNQTSGEWVKGGLPWNSEDTIVNGTYLTVNGFEAFTTDDGRYVIRVNMSFTEEADNNWYSFDVTFLNWTYGPDYSKPWGEYLSEDWVYTTIYTVNNGSIEVYVPKPEERGYVEDPEGRRYLIFSKPYIEIKGEKLPLKEIKVWNGYKYEYRLLQERWDYKTGQQKYYYVLENNTKIYVFEAYNAPIYNVTLYDDEHNTSIITCMEWDWWDRFNDKRFLIASNGTIVWLREETRLNAIQISSVPIEFAGYFVLINGTRWENVTKGWFDWDWRVGQNYMEFTNGTRVYLKYDDTEMYSWYFEKDGERYYTEWPWEYYVGNYSGNTIIVPGWCRRTWYYTIINGEKVEVPYEGVGSERGWYSWWDLERTESEGGVVPEDEYALVNGSLYPINYYTVPEDSNWQGEYGEDYGKRGYIVIDGKLVNVTEGRGFYTKVLGKDVWDVEEVGFTIFLANLTDHGTYDLDNLIELQVANDFYYGENKIALVLINGTSLTAQRRFRVIFYELKLNETSYYVANHRPDFNYTTNSHIFYLLNGSVIEVPMSQRYQIEVIVKDIGVDYGMPPVNFTWQGETYNTTLNVNSWRWIELWYSYYRVDVNGNYYDIVPISIIDGTFTPWDEMIPRWPDDPWSYRERFTIYNATLPNGTRCTLYPKLSHIKMVRPTWGHPYGWHLEEFQWESIGIRKQTYNVIVGTPEWGLWGYRKFKIDPETGALDLDGDLSTTNDQFYVKRVYNCENSFTETRNGLDVHLEYDPNPMIPEDELMLNAWMGVATNTYRNTWNETYFWYYTNMTPVSEETMRFINETIWNLERNTPNPGYWDLSRMTKNMTWEDYLAKAKREGWDWIDEEVSWTWLWFGFEQSYWASTEEENGTFQSYHVNLRYEYSGMFLYKDTDKDSMMSEGEETHYFMPDAVKNVTFITPDLSQLIALSNLVEVREELHNDTEGDPYRRPSLEEVYGEIRIGGNDTTYIGEFNETQDWLWIRPKSGEGATSVKEVYTGNFSENVDPLSVIEDWLCFGVSYRGINGTLFPFGRSYYAWYGEDISGTDLRTFNERPVDANLEELTFKIHFYLDNSTETNSTAAHVKIDQHVGDWTLNLPSNIAVLENLSLSLNYYVYADMSGSWSITSEDGSPIDPNEIVEASKISLDASGLKFADVDMGDTYLWGGNLTKPYNVSSYTVPLETFVNTFTDYGSETSVGGWTFRSTMYFLSVGFPRWDGKYVYEDPEVVVYLGSGKKTLFGSPEGFLAGWNLEALPPTPPPTGQPEEPPGGEEEPLPFGLPTILLMAAPVVVAAVIAISIILLRKRRPKITN